MFCSLIRLKNIKTTFTNFWNCSSSKWFVVQTKKSCFWTTNYFNGFDNNAWYPSKEDVCYSLPDFRQQGTTWMNERPDNIIRGWILVVKTDASICKMIYTRLLDQWFIFTWDTIKTKHYTHWLCVCVCVCVCVCGIVYVR